MDDASDRLLDALSALEGVADEVTSDAAAAGFDAATLQMFWRDWPRVASWCGSLWRRLNDDLSTPASSVRDTDIDEVGGEGG